MKGWFKTLMLTGLMAGLCACAGNDDGMRPQSVNEKYVNHNNTLNAGDNALDLRDGRDNRRPTSFGAHDAQALRITDIAEDTVGVSYASCIVYGRDILVGIKASNQSEAPSLEQKVKRSIQASEPGYNVYVTSNNQMHSRIYTITEYTSNPYSQSSTPNQGQGRIETEVRSMINSLKQTNQN